MVAPCFATEHRRVMRRASVPRGARDDVVVFARSGLDRVAESEAAGYPFVRVVCLRAAEKRIRPKKQTFHLERNRFLSGRKPG